MSMEFPRKDKWEKSGTYDYVIKGTSVSCEWLLQASRVDGCSNQLLGG